MNRLKMKKHNETGLLITFCGLDGCGKTTMIKRLICDLKDKQLFITKQPTPFVRESDIFRTYMDSPDHSMYDYRSLSLLAASDRLQHTHKTIYPHLANGDIVISDRYFYSCLANLRARGYKDDKWIYDVSKSVLKPDISFFFDVPVDIAVARVRSRADEKDRYIDMALQYNLRKEYVDICNKNGGILISTELSEEESYAQVINAVKRMLKNEYRRKSN